jgi:proteasome assembly chaperone (PAC2) family protein
MDDLRWLSSRPLVLRSPVLVLALEGLFDVGGVATEAVRQMLVRAAPEPVAEIDPDPYYDFSQHRPQVWLDDEGERRIAWPENRLFALRYPDGPRDLVVMAGVEPDIRWRSFAAHLVGVAQALRCGVVVTAGASPDAVPHTRLPMVVGSSTNDELARSLGLGRPQYQGPTGLVGVLHQLLDEAGVPAVSLRVGVPHYLLNAQHPRSTAALMRHLSHVLGVDTGHAALDAEIDEWRERHDAAVAEDAQARAYVRMLEQSYDARIETTLPSGDDLAAEFERFLRSQGGDADPPSR